MRSRALRNPSWSARLLTGNLVVILAAPAVVSAAPRLGKAVYAVYALSCHQIAERSFTFLQIPLPVCVRCTGLWLGLALFALFFRTLRRWLSPAKALLLLGVMVSAWYLGTLGLLPDIPAERFLTGLAGGVGLGRLVCRVWSWPKACLGRFQPNARTWRNPGFGTIPVLKNPFYQYRRRPRIM